MVKKHNKQHTGVVQHVNKTNIGTNMDTKKQVIVEDEQLTDNVPVQTVTEEVDIEVVTESTQDETESVIPLTDIATDIQVTTEQNDVVVNDTTVVLEELKNEDVITINTSSDSQEPSSLNEILASRTDLPKIPVEVSPDLEKLIREIEKDSNAVIVLNGIYEYIQNMRPGKPINENSGAGHQRRLLKTIKFALEEKFEDFNKMFATVLKFFDEYKDGVFNGRYVYRFVHYMPVPQSDVKKFNSLINLLTTAGPVNGRNEAVRQIDFIKTLNGLPDDAQRRVMAFFNK